MFIKQFCWAKNVMSCYVISIRCVISIRYFIYLLCQYKECFKINWPCKEQKRLIDYVREYNLTKCIHEKETNGQLRNMFCCNFCQKYFRIISLCMTAFNMFKWGMFLLKINHMRLHFVCETNSDFFMLFFFLLNKVILNVDL